MKERPILFNGEMVRAILDGRKTQTRRVVKSQLDDRGLRYCNPTTGWEDWHGCAVRCPYGQPGDRLWVRETWRVLNDFDRCKPSDVSKDSLIHYQADNGLSYETLIFNHNDGRFGRWRRSIHMPRWASRITLEVTDVRVERVRYVEISPEDAISEGVEKLPYDGIGMGENYKDYSGRGRTRLSAAGSFKTLWNSINEKRGLGWDENPWVWVVEFKKGQTDDQR